MPLQELLLLLLLLLLGLNLLISRYSLQGVLMFLLENLMIVSHLLDAWIVHMSHYTLSALILSKSALTSSKGGLLEVLIMIDIGGCCCYIMLLLMIDVHVRVVV